VVDKLKKYYHVAANAIFGGSETRTVKANETISFEAREAETVAIVGESGCGKSTLAKVLLGLETATEGTVTLGNKEIQSTPIEDRDVDTISSIQMVFQNPFDTLNPSHSVGSQIIRTLEKFKVGNSQADRHTRMLELLDLVKLPRAFAVRMPRQLSGGQKQRIGVARAFAGNAKVVVADEPVSALDVSVQAAVTELLMDIQRKNKTTMLFISHDLSVVRYLADRVVVMYLGYIVEQGTTDQIFSPPYHPYTEALLSAIPIADTSVVKQHIVLEGDIPSALNPPTGCPFQTRCRWKSRVPGNKCETEVPPLKELGNGHRSLCWLDDEILEEMEPVISFEAGASKVAETKRKKPSAKTAKTAPSARQKAKGEIPAARAAAAKKTGRAGARKTPSALPGESAPAKVMTQVGAGRQAVSASTRPATAKRPKTAKQAAPDTDLAGRKAKPSGPKTVSRGELAASGPAPKTARKAPSAAARKGSSVAGKAGPAKARPASDPDRNRPPAMQKPARPDDLKLISGVGPKIEGILNGLGIYSYGQIASWKKAERAWVDGHLKFHGRIEREDWVKQAKALAKGGEAEYVKVFGKKPR
ncbi:MAG: ATP-binding cassette domain-containing protein, partial [Nitratireductor sp.]